MPQQTFWKEIVMNKWLKNLELLNDYWLKEFKMTCKQIFCKLDDMLFLCIKKQDANIRAIILINKAFAIALYRLGYGSTLYMNRHHLGNSPSTSFKFTYNICEVLVTHFYSFESLSRISSM